MSTRKKSSCRETIVLNACVYNIHAAIPPILQINDVDFKVRRSPDKPLPDHSDPMVRKASKLKTLYMVCICYNRISQFCKLRFSLVVYMAVDEDKYRNSCRFLCVVPPSQTIFYDN